MFVKNAHLNDLQNEEHFAFHTDVDEVVTDAGPAVLKIETQYGVYKPTLTDERTALDQVQKSAFTKKMDIADVARDQPIRGFFAVVKGMLHHFNPTVSDAAYRIDVINESFSGITRLSKEKQTSATVSYLDALHVASADIVILGLRDWVTEIDAKNTAFVDTKKNRMNEKDDQTNLHMKDVRREVDAAYNAIVDRINAFITIDGDAKYATLVTKLNNRIDSYNNALAQRKGHAKKVIEATTAPVIPVV